MNRREHDRRRNLEDTLLGLGFTLAEAESLRRISMTLRRWYERECGDGNGCIERENEDGTGRPYWTFGGRNDRYLIPDRETGAKKRLVEILARVNAKPSQAGWLTAYIQTDPRGAALYVLRPGDVPAGQDAGAFYNRGICVY